MDPGLHTWEASCLPLSYSLGPLVLLGAPRNFIQDSLTLEPHAYQQAKR